MLRLPPRLDDYQLLVEAVEAGLSPADDYEALRDLCRRLWVKSPSDRQRFEDYFEQYFENYAEALEDAYQEAHPAPAAEPSNLVVEPGNEVERTKAEGAQAPPALVAEPSNPVIESGSKVERTKSGAAATANDAWPNREARADGIESAPPPRPRPKTSAQGQKPAQPQSRFRNWQAAQAISTFTEFAAPELESQRFPIGQYTLSDEYFRPLTRRQLKQGWVVLRAPQKQGRSDEWDIDATIQTLIRQGFLAEPEYLPNKVDRTELLLLVDRSNSMAPFDLLAERIISTANHAQKKGQFQAVGTFYFRNYIDQKLYEDPECWEAIGVDDFLAGDPAPQRIAIFFSDAGAARGGFNLERCQATHAFLQRLQPMVRQVCWLNPCAEESWQFNTADHILQQVPMFACNLAGWRSLLKDLRGRAEVPARLSAKTDFLPTEAASEYELTQLEEELRALVPQTLEKDEDVYAYEQAVRRLLAFIARMPGSVELLCYLAFPLALTPDLAFFLRENFPQAEETDWLVVPNLLLSSLCRVVGYQLYEIDSRARHLLLKLLKVRQREVGEQRLKQLSDSLLFYIQHRLEEMTLRPRDVGERPEWIALAYTQPNELAKKLARELKQAHPDDFPGQIRLASLAVTLAEPLAEAKFEPLLMLGRAYGRWARGDEQGADRLLGELPADMRFVDVEGIRLRILGEEIDPLELFPLEWITVESGRLVLDDKPQLPVFKTMEYEVAKIVLESPPNAGKLQPFEFETATLHQRGSSWHVEKQPGQARRLIEYLTDDVELEMVEIPAGHFTMGSPKNEERRSDDEGPQHEVSVPSFLMGRYLVTQAQWRAVAAMVQVERKLNLDPSDCKGEALPVERVSWEDATEFCNRLSQHSGQTYRLPSEAEWEYACRAGTTTPFHFGETLTDKVANYRASNTYASGPKGQRREKTTVVGCFPANAWGLHDMHGNVREWCLDPWHNSYEGAPTNGSAWLKNSVSQSCIQRGGSWDFDPRNCRSACRHFDPSYRDYYGGFRVMCELPRTL